MKLVIELRSDDDTPIAGTVTDLNGRITLKMSQTRPELFQKTIIEPALAQIREGAADYEASTLHVG